MDILFLLIPLSVVLVFVIIVVLALSVQSGQFESLDREALRVLEDDDRSGEASVPSDVNPRS